jgi:hypothetical protein
MKIEPAKPHHCVDGYRIAPPVLRAAAAKPSSHRFRPGCGEQPVRLQECDGFHAKAAEAGRAMPRDTRMKW